MRYSLINSPVVTDVCTDWTEAIPILARGQSLVVAGLAANGCQLPFAILGIDSNNGRWRSTAGKGYVDARAFPTWCADNSIG